MTTTPAHVSPILTVDVVMLAMIGKELHVALMLREGEPYRYFMALPGGYVHTQTDVDVYDAAARILRTKLDFTANHLEQVFTQASATRDPRGWSASVVYLALHDAQTLQALEAAGKVTLSSVHDLPEMAFDHRAIIESAVQRLQAKAAYSSIGGYLLPREFTISALHGMVQCLLDKKINSANFRRKILDQDVLVETPSTLNSRGRPAQTYRLRPGVEFFARELA